MSDITLFSECFFPNPLPVHLNTKPADNTVYVIGDTRANRRGGGVQITGAWKVASVPAMLYIFLSFLVIPLFVDCLNYPFQTRSKSFCSWGLVPCDLV